MPACTNSTWSDRLNRNQEGTLKVTCIQYILKQIKFQILLAYDLLMAWIHHLYASFMPCQKAQQVLMWLCDHDRGHAPTVPVQFLLCSQRICGVAPSKFCMPFITLLPIVCFLTYLYHTVFSLHQPLNPSNLKLHCIFNSEFLIRCCLYNNSGYFHMVCSKKKKRESYWYIWQNECSYKHLLFIHRVGKRGAQKRY